MRDEPVLDPASALGQIIDARPGQIVLDQPYAPR
jgi:hypothetical protein